MILFKCVFTEKEFASLQTTLPTDDYCIIRLRDDEHYYGIMDDRFHGNFMDILSGETLEQLEYLDEEDMRHLFVEPEDYEFNGNISLLKSIL